VDNYNIFTNTQIDIITNEILPIQVLEEARKKFGSNFTFTYVSTWFVYGDNPLEASEGDPCKPKGFYAITKLAGEQLVRSYCKTYGIPWKVLRLGSVVGAGDYKASLKKNAMQYLIGELVRGHTVEIYDEPSYRDIIDVRDCVHAMHLAMKRGIPNQIYNIGNGMSVNIKETLEWVNKKGHGEIKYIPVPDFHKQVQAQRFYMDTTKLKMLGYVREYSLGDTLMWLINTYEK
jgi:nucleoside-diphosphate-sugar epimerase